MKRGDALEVARIIYKEQLEAGGTSDFAISNALSSGYNFLNHYERAKNSKLSMQDYLKQELGKFKDRMKTTREILNLNF